MKIEMKSMENFNDLVIEIEARLQHNKLDKELLIAESFTLWYILVEGIYCENFSEEYIKNLLLKNTKSYQNSYSIDADYNFIMGWMLRIAFWYFEPLLKERDGILLLKRAYKDKPQNSLFKWAVRDELQLEDVEINNLKMDISLRFDEFYYSNALIKEYFLDVICSSKWK